MDFTQQELELMKSELNIADQLLVSTLLMVHELGDFDLKRELNDYHYDMTMVENRVNLAVMGKGGICPWDERFILNAMRENDWNRFHAIAQAFGIDGFDTCTLLACHVLRNKLKNRVNEFYGKAE